MSSFFNVLSKEDKIKLLKIKDDANKANPTPEYRWEKAILMDKPLIHNFYVNIILELFGKVNELDIEKMINDKKTAFSPCECRKIQRMMDELGVEFVTKFFNSLVYVLKGTIVCRRFRIEREYLEIKINIYTKHHPQN